MLFICRFHSREVNMESEKKQLNNYRVAAAVTVAVFCMGQIPGSIDAAISKITDYFHLTSTSGLYVTTIACIVSVVFSTMLGFFAGKKVGFKPLIIFCATVELVSALVPFFAENFVFFIILRGLFGIGFGGMQSLENTVATKLVTPERRAKVLGLGTFFGFGMNCLLQFVGGVLADAGWNYVFLNHLLLIIPYVIILIGLSKVSFEGQDKLENNTRSETAAHKKLNISVFHVWLLILFVGIVIAPLLVGCSFLSAPLNSSATVAGVVAVCFSAGCMIGGVLFPKMQKLLKSWTLTAFLIVTVVGLVGCAMTRSIVILCIMILIGGIGFAATQATLMMILGLSTSSDRIALASAVMMALFNLGMFLSSTYENAIAAITGDALYMPLYIGAGILLVFAIIYSIFSPMRRALK